MKPLVLSEKNILEVIKNIEKTLKKHDTSQFGTKIYLPNSEKILSTRYKGNGRPKKSDYDYKKIDWSKIKETLIPYSNAHR